jgi:cholesterol transport system auxiliary component
MTCVRPAAATLIALTLAACAIGKPIPEATTYVVEPPPPVPTATRRAQTLRMGKVRVAPAFAGKALVVRLDEVRYSADFYQAFIAEPGDLLGARMADWLNQAGPFRSVAQPGATAPTSYVLDATVTELYGDFRPGLTPTAVMTVQFALVNLEGVSPKAVLERTIGRRIPLREASPDALVRGYGQALAEILAELVPQLARTR